MASDLSHDAQPEHGDDHHHDGHHGHQNDQGLSGALRYLRRLPRMWRSDINDAVVDEVAPTAGERVVDIGAGMGAGAFRAAATGAHVVAVEPTPFMRRMLQARRAVSRRRRHLEVAHGTAERLPVEGRSIDAIWAVNTMHHWSDVDLAVSEIVRVLGSGGRMLLIDEAFTDPTHPDHERFRTDEDQDHHHGFTMIDAEGLGELFRSAGLTDVEAGADRLAGIPVIRITGIAASTSGT